MLFKKDFIIQHRWGGELIAPETRISLDLLIDGSGARIQIDAPFHGDAPPQDPPGSTWALWEYEVVELFLVDEDGSYLELEFGPHGHFLGLRLAAPREMVSTHLKLDYRSQIVDKRWFGKAFISTEHLPIKLSRWNAFAISGNGSARQYLTWSRLPGQYPDFHQPQHFPRV